MFLEKEQDNLDNLKTQTKELHKDYTECQNCQKEETQTTNKDNQKEDETFKNQPNKTKQTNTKQQKHLSKESSHQQITKLQTQIKELQQKLSQQKKTFDEGLLKNQAEFINFKKRAQTQKENELKYASSNFINNLLMPLEQLEKVIDMPTQNELLQKYLLGFKLLQKQIKKVLQDEGVEEIEALNKPFDPTFHHALETVCDFEKPDKTNLAVLQKGYLYKKRILRPTLVKVNEWSDKNEKNE
ncbi:molecular chaperone GrpE protein [Aster yellows witches'-broom phytoplasma AYWB]|uniref:Protein GrpE n=1 Tax=Aster yellows witches'-broom phytoplasma (strain AYWB) TaxID=322098 RepID=GRPE_AYWBP|nr:nucleotide exchange factor GrpE [Aster yellows witches'-broom phytoplasma]Q2NK66.1 RecName: Full=Protein GrpE; AltName: Full=HSP-70 cofactor [Aster yellows witches'-broom phytoplasma AYWB]ABC65177.1 molecular chaperone GrpE protein [Aster yellows witches'-broom phytoplasma AYWB]